MLDRQDILLLKGMFDTTAKDIILQLRDETRAQIGASENRMIRRMDDMRMEIVDDISEILDISVFPKIDELRTGIANLRRQNHLV